MSDKLFYLLQVNDALFPIGGYSHSQGLETYIQKGLVHDEETAKEYELYLQKHFDEIMKEHALEEKNNKKPYK